MLDWLLLILFNLLCIELLMRLPLLPLTRSMAMTGLRAGQVMTSPHISDHWKERVMPVYAGSMARKTLALGGGFALLGGLALLLILAMARLDPAAEALLLSQTGVASCFALALLHLAARRYLVRT